MFVAVGVPFIVFLAVAARLLWVGRTAGCRSSVVRRTLR